MTTMRLYAVCDRKTGQYGAPMLQHNDQTAMRTLALEVNRADAVNTVYQNPEDFSLVYLGTYDNETGVIESEIPRVITEAVKLKKAI